MSADSSHAAPLVAPLLAPLLIVQIDPPHAGQGGDWYYRSFLPGRALSEEPSVYVINLDSSHRKRAELWQQADVIVLNAVVDPDLLPLITARRKQRLLTVYEVNDDVSAVSRANPVHDFFAEKENQHLFFRLARESDADQYSVTELSRLYGYLNARSRIFPNQLAEVSPHRTTQGPVIGPLKAKGHGDGGGDDVDRPPLVIGWGGSHGHLDDIASVVGPLVTWASRREGVVLHLMGSEPIWRLFDALPPARKRHTRPGTIWEFYAFLRGLDIGLAPLLDTGFNRARSDVKFLEYAASGAVPVLQALTPYLETVRPGDTGLLFRDPQEMIAILDELVADPAKRARVASAAHRYVSTERVQRLHNQDRLGFYRELLAGVGHVPRTEAQCSAWHTAACAWEGAEAKGRHLLLRPTRYELLLHDGLLLSQQHGRPKEAAAAFAEAARLAPECYQPHLYLAAAGQQVHDSLVAALRRNPQSLQAWLTFGLQHLLHGDATAAIERFLVAAKIHPSYEVPYLRTARALRALGQEQQAAQMEQQAQELLAPLAPP